MKTSREQWSNRFDFLFVTIGAAVGLGNIWRFPYLCYKNGGGAFMIPYCVTLFLVALPQLILQVSVGQFTSRSPTKAWDIVPVMRGIGFSTTYYAYTGFITYATVLAWAMYYFYESFSSILPWTTCNNSWNTPNCYAFNSDAGNFSNITLRAGIVNVSANVTQVSPAREFWESSVLNMSTGLTDEGGFRTNLLICLVITWMICFICMMGGINWTSKVTYVTAPLPIILLLAVLIRGLTLDGAMEGLKYFLLPDLKSLLKPQVWKDAALQNLYSLSIGAGSMIALGSFNKKHHNFYRDCLTLSFVNACASIISGVAVFSTLGFMAKQQNTTVYKVAKAGPGLVFAVYPEAIAMMPLPQVWSALFFFMLLLLGFDSLFVGIESIVAAITDLAPRFFQKQWKKSVLNLGVCVSMMILALPTVTQNGVFYVYLLDNFASTSWGMLFGCACQCIAIAWMFGLDLYYEEICRMLQYRPSFPWFKYCWKYFTPVVFLCLFGYCLALYQPLVYDRTYRYPTWSLVIGWIISLIGFLLTPSYAIYYLIRRKFFHSYQGHAFQVYNLKVEETTASPFLEDDL